MNEQRRRKRAGRRKKRDQKRGRKHEKHLVKIAAATHTCPDCGDTWMEYGKEPMHRLGPCGASPEDVAVMKATLKELKTGNDECRNCDALSGERMVIHIETRCVWDGCQNCWNDNTKSVIKKIDQIRATWKNKTEGVERFVPSAWATP